MNLIEGTMIEIKRCRELIEVYKEIPTGGFAIAMIEQAIFKAEKAIGEGDTVAMVRCCKELKACE